MKKYIVEGLGAGMLTLVVGLSLQTNFPVSTPILAALVVGIFVYLVGSISGAHLNPAVTIGIWGLRKISNMEALMYIIFQFIGSFAAMLAIKSVFKLPDLIVTNSIPVFVAELVGAFLLTFGISSFVYEKVSKDSSGIVIGGSLLLGIAVAALLGSNGLLNPAVAFGIGSFNLSYILGPIVGALLGTQSYRYLSR